MSITWHDSLGALGVILVLLAYDGLQMERLSTQTASYHLLNLFGAGLILVSLMYNFNMPSFLIELAWVAISLYGLARYILFKKI